MAFSTETFVVDPIFFPGGSIGDLAVNGTVNDLAMREGEHGRQACIIGEVTDNHPGRVVMRTRVGGGSELLICWQESSRRASAERKPKDFRSGVSEGS